MKTVIITLILLQIGYTQRDTLIVSFDANLIDASHIKSTTNEWVVSYFKSNTLINKRRWTDYIDVNSKNNTLFRKQELYQNDSLLTIWLNLTEYPSLKPIYNSANAPNTSFSFVTYERNKVSYLADSPGQNKINDSSKIFENDVYDWTLYGILLTGLKPNSNVVYKIPIYIGPKSTPQLNYLTVEFIKQINITDLKGHSFNCWEIQTNQNLTFWISDQSPYVIKLKYKPNLNITVIWDKN